MGNNTILSKDLVDVIESYLQGMLFGKVIISRHDTRLTIDVENRDRKYVIDIKK